MAHTVKILATEMLNHNVKRFTTERPQGLNYTPGQAVLVESPEMKVGKRPFTFTGLLTAPELEFTIKLYHDHHGVTDHLTDYKPGDTLKFGNPWGGHQISRNGNLYGRRRRYHAVFRYSEKLHKGGRLDGNALWFSNKRVKDIFPRKRMARDARGSAKAPDHKGAIDVP
jgi:hypothetical protein